MVDEKQRLNALYATGLLDTDAEERFDRLTRLAANMLGVKSALISLVDDDRQWFKSKIGTEVEQTSRDIAFCDHAIRLPDEIMVVPDTHRDDRFADNPLVTGDPFVRFYAGVPLVTGGGDAIGTLCVLDNKPREGLDLRERAILTDLAASAMLEIEQGREIEDLQVVNAELKHRMGNMYAHISALVSLIGRDEQDKDRLVKRLQEKISSFGTMQQLLADQDWRTVRISQLTDSVLATFRADRPSHQIQVQPDDDFKLSARGAFIITLMLGELATNAVKHGALSNANGIVHFTWSTDNDDGSYCFDWRERCDRAIDTEATSAGFGTDILKRIVPMDMRGQAELTLHRDGLEYRVTGRPERLSEQ